MTEPNLIDVKLAVDTLKSKFRPMKTLEDYYNGDQPLHYSTERLKELFNKLKIDFKINWCSVIIDTILDRMSLQGWVTKSPEINDFLADLFDRNHLDIISQDIHRNALIKSEAYVMVEEDDEGQITMYFNDPSMCHLFYDAENPTIKRMGVKSWIDGKDSRLNLYYTDETHRYQKLQKDKDYTLLDQIPNAWGKIPLFQFRNSLSGRAFSELKKVLSLQDGVNKLFADLMVASEFATIKQKYVITNADTEGLSNEPNAIWNFPPSAPGEQPTTIGEFGAADLNNYLGAIDKMTYWASVITRTPKHYFSEGGSAPSGESLLVMESPLVKKVSKYIDLYSVTWEEIAEFCIHLDQQVELPEEEAKGEKELQSTWESPESVLLATQMTVVKTGKESGIPVKTMLRKVGWDQKEIDQYEADLKEEKKAGANEAKLLLDQVRKENETNNNLNGEEEDAEEGDDQTAEKTTTKKVANAKSA